MKTFQVNITTSLELTLDETAFTEAFLKEYRENFSNKVSIEDHVENIAQHYVAGRVWSPDLFLEGYGNMTETLNAKIKEVGRTSEVEEIEQ